MNKVHAAYQKLGVAPGTSLEAAKKRHRQLAMVWHPDRMPTPDGRRNSEEELKQINNAFDCIKKHFESDHRQGPGCMCQPTPANNQQTGSAHYQNASNSHSGGNGQAAGNQGASNPGAHQRQKTTYEYWAEQEARAEAERRRRAEEAAHEAALKEMLEKARRAAETEAAAKAAAAAKAKAQNTNTPCTEEQLRWKLAAAVAAIFVFLLIGGFNKRHEPTSISNSEFSESKVEHLNPSPFLN